MSQLRFMTNILLIFGEKYVNIYLIAAFVGMLFIMMLFLNAQVNCNA